MALNPVTVVLTKIERNKHICWESPVMLGGQIKALQLPARSAVNTRSQEEAEKEPPLQVSEGAWPCQRPGFGFLASRTENKFVILKHPVFSPLLRQTQEAMQAEIRMHT